MTQLRFNGKMLRTLREVKHISQGELALMIGCRSGNALIGRWERGTTDPQGASVVALARALDVKVEDLYRDVEGTNDAA